MTDLPCILAFLTDFPEKKLKDFNVPLATHGHRTTARGTATLAAWLRHKSTLPVEMVTGQNQLQSQ